jgi:hypothetical protein
MARLLVALLSVLAAALVLAPAAGAVDPLPLTKSVPADGMVIPPTPSGGFSWGIGIAGLPEDAQVSVTISTTRTLSSDGVTLATGDRVDFFFLQPDVVPGTYAGQSEPGPNPWTAILGTYFWQVTATWTDASGVFHSAASAIARLVIGSPPATPAPSPSAGGGSARTTLAMSSLDATYYIRQLIRRHTKRPATRLRYNCARRTSRSFRCRPTWRDSRNRYSATATITHSRTSGRIVASASLSGRRASRQCVTTRSLSACRQPFRWRSVIATRPRGTR